MAWEIFIILEGQRSNLSLAKESQAVISNNFTGHDFL